MHRRVLIALACLAACKGGGKPRRASDAAPVAEVGEHAAAAPADAEAAVAAVPDAGVAPGGRPEHAVWHFGDNLLTAHRGVGGDLVIDAGSIGFARYARFGVPVVHWRFRQTVGGRRVAVARHGAPIELPLTADQAAAARGFGLRLVVERKARLTVKLGGRKVAVLEVEPGRAWYAVPLARGVLVEGENAIVIEGGPVALETVRVFADAHVLTDDDPLTHAGWDPVGRGLELDDGAGLAWYVHLPPLAHVVADLAGDCRVEVNARTDDGTRAGGLLGGGSRAVDLSMVGDQAVRLELTARDCPRAVLADPVITVSGAASPPGPDGEPPEYVILWIMDALRADRIRPFTPGARPEVPAFDQLAETGAVFRQYYVQGNESQTSHSTLWTGTYPAVHNVRLAGDGGNWKIPSRLAVIGELVKAAGLDTVGVTGNGFITADGGYTRGFDEFRNMMRELGPGVINGVLFGAKVRAEVERRLHLHQGRPTFVFMGTVDTHGPWIARKPWIDRYDGPKPYTGPFQEFGTAKDLGIHPGVMGCTRIPPPRDIARLRAIYDSAVSYHDQQLGLLVAELERMGIYEKTLLIVTADHGEELFEDRRCGHGGSLRESLVRVPFLVHYPARVAAGVIEEGAEGVDLLPTILDALGADIPDQVQGQSLLPVAAGAVRGWPRPSYASQFEYAHAMRIARWKIKIGPRGAPIILDVVADPDERVDLSATRPTVRRLLTDSMGLFLATRARWHKRTMGVVTNLAPGAAALLEGR